MLPLISGILAIILLVVLIVHCKLSPFIALIISSLLLGLVNGLGVEKTVSAFAQGLGDQLSDTAIIIGLGAIIGSFLVDSGGAERIATVIVGRSKKSLIPVAIGFVALVIELPSLFEVAFVLLIPIVFSVSKKLGKNPLFVAMPMAAGMMTAHGLLPPGPATVIGASAVDVDLGLVAMLGIIVAVPVFVAGVWFFPKIMSKHYLKYEVSDGSGISDQEVDVEHAPSLGVSLPAVLLAPALLILGTIGKAFFPEGTVGYEVTQFLGNSVIALLLAALYALIFLGLRTGMSADKTLGVTKKSFKGIVNVLMTIGAGGGLKQMLESIKLSQEIADVTAQWAIPVVLLAWIIAALFRVALGSGTVAVTAAAGIVAPMVAQADDVHKALVVLAIAVGAMIFSHVNDGAFWLFKEYLNMTVPQTLRTWSTLVTVQSVVGLVFLLILNSICGLIV
ncbi:MAG: GntP family permease [Bifidobacteriaceae bacterium]|jgi:GntP family gluconate:H+ symporter|nr:GntP family permease [Bifidobacteriaceae bacterium]